MGGRRVKGPVGLSFEAQKNIEVYDEETLVGYYIPDFIVEEKVVVEIKAHTLLDRSDLSQVITYLVVTGCPVGLLINFGQRSLKPRRVFPPPQTTEHHVNYQALFVPDWLKVQRDTADTD